MYLLGVAMGYVSNVIGKDEAVSYEGHISLLAYWKSFLVGGFFLALGLKLLDSNWRCSMKWKHQRGFIPLYFFLLRGIHSCAAIHCKNDY